MPSNAEDQYQIEHYECFAANPWSFTEVELEFLKTNDMNMLRERWGYWTNDKEGAPPTYEARTHSWDMDGGRALQEYTDVLFRILTHVLVNGATRVFGTDAMPKIASQTDSPLITRASMRARQNMQSLVAEFINEPGVREKLQLLAEHSMNSASAGFACFIYTARQLFRMAESVENFSVIDRHADLWYQRMCDLEL
jgi:hypothetical protein